MQAELIAAIQGRRVVEFYWKDHHRVGEPHLLGICALQIEMYQTGGYTSGKKGRLPAWRKFDVDEIRGLQVTAETFEVQGTFNPRSKYWQRVIASVER